MYKLLIVEDEEIIRKGLRKQVPWNDMGFQIAGEAENGKAALDLISELCPDVIFTDVRMPVMDGLEMMAKLRCVNPDLKVVILSGYSDFEYAKKGIEYGASAYLLKPTKNREIKETFLKIKRELDNSAANKAQIESLKKKSENGVIHLKDRFFKDLLDGKYVDEDEILEHMKDFKLEVRQDENSGVLLLQATSCISNPAVVNTGRDASAIEKDLCYISDLFERIAEYFSGIRVLEMLRMDKSSTIAAVICCNTKVDKKDIMRFAEKIKEEIGVNNIVTAGIGNQYNTLLKLRASYQEAKTALNHGLRSREGSVIHICDCVHGDALIEKLKTYINDNFTRKITLDELAEFAYINSSYLSSLFRQKTGHTITDYLSMVRIGKARELLKKPEFKVYEVSVMVGYDDFRHFSKVFNRLEGIKPAEYRKNHALSCKKT